MHARANRIIEDAGKTGSYKTSSINEHEFRLIKLIAISSDMVEKAYIEGRPNVITDYLNDLSSSFSSFYESCPILKSEADTKAFRVAITNAFKETSSAMLHLLGIEPLARM
jgi:arginyl-tRNA synthetase